MFGRARKSRVHVYSERRKLRIRRYKQAGKEYVDFFITLPRAWVKRILRELGYDPENPPPNANIVLEIEYNGDIIIKAPT